MPPRGQSELSEANCGRILALHEEGYSYREIAARVPVSASGAYKIVQRYQNHNTYHSLPRSGRPPALPVRTRRLILRTIRSNRFDPYRVIAQRIGWVTMSQVAQVAREEGYRRCVAVTKPFLKPKMVTQRIEWAETNDGRDWESVIWTDEVVIETGAQPKRLMVTRKPVEEYLPECVASSYRSGRDSIIVWAAVAHNAKGPILRLEKSPYRLGRDGRKRGGGLSAQGYAEQVLSGPLKEFWTALQEERQREILVVEDGASPHRGKIAQATREQIGIRQLTHPPNSPDLNPIEPLWFLLKKRVAAVPGSGNNRESLWAAVKMVWDGITIEEVNKHTGQMDARVMAVKKAKGYHTRF